MVFVVQGNKLIRKEVIFGESNFDYVEIVTGLYTDEEIVISDMSDFKRHKKIRIK